FTMSRPTTHSATGGSTRDGTRRHRPPVPPRYLPRRPGYESHDDSSCVLYGYGVVRQVQPRVMAPGAALRELQAFLAPCRSHATGGPLSPQVETPDERGRSASDHAGGPTSELYWPTDPTPDRPPTGRCGLMTSAGIVAARFLAPTSERKPQPCPIGKSH